MPPVAMPRIAGGTHECVAIGRGQNRVEAFQNDIGIPTRRRVDRDLEATGLHVLRGHPEQASHFAGMRREARCAVARDFSASDCLSKALRPSASSTTGSDVFSTAVRMNC